MVKSFSKKQGINMITITDNIQIKIDNSDEELKVFIQTLLKANNKNESRLELIMKQSDRQQLKLVKLNEDMKVLSETDKLTSLFNRLKSEEILISLIEEKKPFSLLLVDLDNFNLINEKFTLSIADAVLIQISKILRQFKKSTSAIGRWAGDSFLFIDPTLTLDEMLETAEEINEKIESLFFDDIGKVTVSIGVSHSSGNSSLQDIVNKMNRALKKAKDSGKNQVSL